MNTETENTYRRYQFLCRCRCDAHCGHSCMTDDCDCTECACERCSEEQEK